MDSNFKACMSWEGGLRGGGVENATLPQRSKSEMVGSALADSGFDQEF